MILYVNGCSHTAAAEAVVPYCFAEDDPELYHLGRRPHPMNVMASWAMELGRQTHLEVYMDAESASSNDRIDRTTRAWIENNLEKAKQSFMILQWTSWEREEWLHDSGQYYQVNASGIDHVPPEWQDRYRRYIVGVDWQQKTQAAHDKIWALHQYLNDLRVPHLFFNGTSTFSDLPNEQRKNWENCYINPYDRDQSYYNYCLSCGFREKTHGFYHLGADAHSFWADYVLQYMLNHQMLDTAQL
jgi:hypothetical protein